MPSGALDAHAFKLKTVIRVPNRTFLKKVVDSVIFLRCAQTQRYVVHPTTITMIAEVTSLTMK